jgi:hypothetical protein
MSHSRWVVLSAVAFLTVTARADVPLFTCVASCTIWGGFEDTVTPPNASDYDYNDLVFSLIGSGLTLNTVVGDGALFAKPAVLNASAGTAPPNAATPFWNDPSLDGAGGFNVGWCIYGGGACNGGVGLAPGDLYAANAGGKSLNDITFSTGGSVGGTLTLRITSNANDRILGYCTGPTFTTCTSLGLASPGDSVTFSPGGNFILEATNGTQTFSTDMGVGGSVGGNPAATTPASGISQFAFFTPTATPVPEPGSIALLGTGLIALAAMARKRRKSMR